MLHRTNSDGVLVFPVRGKDIPLCPDGYLPDPTDPYVFHLDVSPCPYREQRRIELECRCGFKNNLHCNQLGFLVNRIVCHKCQTIDGWLERTKREWNIDDSNSVQEPATAASILVQDS